jgi:hypothetical protein
MSPVSLPDEVRAACAWVAERARSVRINEEAIAEYAAGLPQPAADDERPPFSDADPETAAAFAICMNAINFGSGWWPTIRKRPGHSGYATIAAGVIERFSDEGPWSARELREMDPKKIAAIVGQDPEHPLMGQFSMALENVGDQIDKQFDGRFSGPGQKAESIPALVEIFASWEAFADVSTYEGRAVPFFKRAQLAAADLCRAEIVDLPGFNRLTAFADNLVPHVLRLDNVISLAPGFASSLDKTVLVPHGAPAEIELRACAVHAVELLSSASKIPPAEIDGILWNRGRDSRYKSVPRPRSRNTAY